MEETVNGLTLKEWTQQVDALFWDEFSIGVYEILGDFCSWDMWHDEMTPEEAYEDLSGDARDTVESMIKFGESL